MHVGVWHQYNPQMYLTTQTSVPNFFLSLLQRVYTIYASVVSGVRVNTPQSTRP
jgi:hypothetical protein